LVAEDEQRLAAAESLAKRLDRPMGVLGIIFLLVVLAQLLVTDPTGQAVLSVISWVFWGVFVAEFLLRAYVARFQKQFWRKNWWQVITIWQGPVSWCSRVTLRREVAVEPGGLAGRGHRDYQPDGQSTALYFRRLLKLS
jgi:hypothetical protein